MQGQRGRNERRAGVFLDVAHLILDRDRNICSAVYY